jgi:hypothetical protein
MMGLKEQHKKLLRHVLGMQKDSDCAWRNYVVVSEGHADMPALNELLMGEFITVRDNPGGSGYLFRATNSGREAVGAKMCN